MEAPVTLESALSVASSVLPLLCDSELYITTLIEILQGRISTTSALCGSDTAAVIRSLADNRASLLRTAHARLHSINKLAAIKYSELDALEDAAGDAARACDASASLHASALASLALSVHSTVSLLETCNSLNSSSIFVGLPAPSAAPCTPIASPFETAARAIILKLGRVQGGPAVGKCVIGGKGAHTFAPGSGHHNRLLLSLRDAKGSPVMHVDPSDITVECTGVSGPATLTLTSVSLRAEDGVIRIDYSLVGSARAILLQPQCHRIPLLPTPALVYAGYTGGSKHVGRMGVKVDPGGPGVANAIAVSPDERLIVVAHLYKFPGPPVTLHSLPEGDIVSSFALPVSSCPVSHSIGGVCFSPTGDTFLVADEDANAVVELDLSGRSVRKLVAPRAHAVAWSKDVIAVGASHPPWNASGIITLIHAATGEPFASFGSVGFRDTDFSYTCSSILIHPDGKHIIASDGAGAVFVYTIGGDLLLTFGKYVLASGKTSLCLAADNRLVGTRSASADSKGLGAPFVFLFDWQAGTVSSAFGNSTFGPREDAVVMAVSSAVVRNHLYVLDSKAGCVHIFE